MPIKMPPFLNHVAKSAFINGNFIEKIYNHRLFFDSYISFIFTLIIKIILGKI